MLGKLNEITIFIASQHSPSLSLYPLMDGIVVMMYVRSPQSMPTEYPQNELKLLIIISIQLDLLVCIVKVPGCPE